MRTLQAVAEVAAVVVVEDEVAKAGRRSIQRRSKTCRYTKRTGTAM